jgi:hypothetical protein
MALLWRTTAGKRNKRPNGPAKILGLYGTSRLIFQGVPRPSIFRKGRNVNQFSSMKDSGEDRAPAPLEVRAGTTSEPPADLGYALSLIELFKAG